MGKLSAAGIKSLAPGKHEDGDGLRLHVTRPGAGRWVFRFSQDGKRHEMGLGGYPATTLAEARAKAVETRGMVKSGLNPIHHARAETTRRRSVPTFGEMADEYFAAKSPEWRNEKHRDQWKKSLTVDAAAIRPIPIDQITTDNVLAILKPVWSVKNESASRLRQRIEGVLDFATAHKARSGDNPARWAGHLEHLLAKRQRLAKGHHAALPYADIPDFYGRLREVTTTGALCLQFTILTAARSAEAYGARWDEIDLKKRLWTIPAHRTKPGRVHVVPLTPAAVDILETMAARKESPVFVFPGQRRGHHLSHIAMAKVIERLETECTVHGFRSSFRDWAGDMTDFPREVAEAALAHSVGDAAEQAYRRGDALEKRRQLMSAWAEYLGGAK